MVIESDMLINKKAGEIYRFSDYRLQSFLQVTFFSLKFVSSLYSVVTTYIISSLITTESPVILFEYFQFHKHMYYNFFHRHDVLLDFAPISIFSLLIWITFSAMKFTFTIAWIMFCYYLWFNCSFYYIKDI